MINLDKYGTSAAYTWNHEYLLQVLTTGKNPLIRKQNLITAFHTVNRQDFVPEQYKSIANADKEINIGYGCILDKPTVIAQMLSLMEPNWNGNYLDIGTGSGYVAALLGVAAGEQGTVHSIERVQFLVDIAKINIAKIPSIKNVHILLKDGSMGLKEHAPYNGIHIAVAFERVPEFISNQLRVGGKLICPTTANDIRIVERISENEFKETIERGYFFDEIIQGIE